MDFIISATTDIGNTKILIRIVIMPELLEHSQKKWHLQCYVMVWVDYLKEKLQVLQLLKHFVTGLI